MIFVIREGFQEERRGKGKKKKGKEKMRREVKKRERRKERGKGKKKVGRGNRKGRKTIGIIVTILKTFPIGNKSVSCHTHKRFA